MRLRRLVQPPVRYIVPPSAAEHFRLLALSSGTLYRRGDVGTVARDLLQATEGLFIHAVLPGHRHALTYDNCVLLFY